MAGIASQRVLPAPFNQYDLDDAHDEMVFGWQDYRDETALRGNSSLR